MAYFRTTRPPEQAQPNPGIDQFGTWRSNESPDPVQHEGDEVLSSCRHELCPRPHISYRTKMGNSGLTKVGCIHLLGVPDQLREDFAA